MLAWEDVENTYYKVMGPPDPRTAEWSMVKSPIPSLILIGSYVLFVTKIGPRYMKNRKAFELRVPMIIYNFFMVVTTLYLVIEGGKLTWFGKYNWRCQPVDRSDNPDALRIAKIGWMMFIFRFFEFLDTIFFVLRKKFTHITLLHVFHHSAVPFCGWIGMKYVPGGHASLIPFLNLFVHVIMYTYYGLAAIGPHVQKYLWWKKYLTLLQMAQFLTIFLHNFQLFFTECDYRPVYAVLAVLFSVTFFFMFLNFYIQQFIHQKRKQQQMAKEELTNGHHKSLNNNGNVHNGNCKNHHD